MKKQINKIVSFVLVFMLMCFSLVSCIKLGQHPQIKYYPEGYTGGFGISPGEKAEFYWVETYIEAREGIDLLKSNGSTFEKNILLSCDESLFDVKYCFIISGDQCYKLGEGENFFDRKLENVEVWSFIFFDDVSIDTLVYSYVWNYNGYRILNFSYNDEINYDEFFASDSLRYELNEYDMDYTVYYEKHRVFDVMPNNQSTDCLPLSEEAMNLIISKIELI